MGARTTVEDPLMVDTFDADGRGRISLGKEFAEKNVRIVVDEVIEEED